NMTGAALFVCAASLVAQDARFDVRSRLVLARVAAEAVYFLLNWSRLPFEAKSCVGFLRSMPSENRSITLCTIQRDVPPLNGAGPPSSCERAYAFAASFAIS